MKEEDCSDCTNPDLCKRYKICVSLLESNDTMTEEIIKEDGRKVLRLIRSNTNLT